MKTSRLTPAILVSLLLWSAARLAFPAGGPLDNASNRLLMPLASRAAALFQDTDGDLDMDDPNDRDFIRATVDDRVLAFANHFSQTVDINQIKNCLSRLIDPAIVGAIPSSFWAAFQNLPQVPTDGSWGPADAANLKKVRAAFALVSLMEYGAPGKFALFEDPSGAKGGVDLFAAEQASDPELLKKIKEYEDGWQRLVLVKILGLAPGGPDPAVVGLATAKGLAGGVANAPGDAILTQWWATVLAGPLKPPSDIWKINKAWWDLNPNAAKVKTKADEADTAAGKTTIVSGAQLLGTELRAVSPAFDPESLLEKISTADNWKIVAKYQSFPDGTPISGGNWTQSGTALTYGVPGGATPSPTRTSNVALMSLTLENQPLDLFLLDKSYQVAYNETYSSEEAGPILPARAVLTFLNRLLEAREKFAANQPATIGDFSGGSSGTPSNSGSFSSSAGIGAAM